MIRYLLALFAFILPLPALAQGAVTSADPRASQAGQEILRAGGSAADAALAMMLALTVVEPQSSGIGGGGFILHHDAKARKLQTIDGRETAPAAATPQRFLGPDGKPMPYRQAVLSGRSVGVPGNVRLMAMAHRKWGKLAWPRLFEPAIRLADGGFQVTAPLAARSAQLAPAWGDFPAIRAIYAPDGKPVAEGSTLRNPALAALLRRIAAEGPDAFYNGPNAQALVAAVNASRGAPGDMTAADFAAYRAKERPPVCGRYRMWRICGMGPPSSGATTVLGILGMLERFDLKALGPNNAQSWHLIAEAMQLAYADREKYLGDADFVAVPVRGLVDRGYLQRRSRLISPLRALGAYPAGNPPGAPARRPAVQTEPAGTTHFIAVDAAGNVATVTSTVESAFGSNVVANGLVLNNELTDFTHAPEVGGLPVANRVQGGKRPLSSMSPTIVYDASGKPVFTVGAAGGKTIIMQVAKALIAHLDWGMPAQQAIGEGLIYFSRDGLILEQGTAREALKPELERLGHRVRVDSLGLKANAAELTAAGWRGAADPRSVGTALIP
ncbi:gamma-glutamyltransferase [Sphingomonas lenta]|uniref:Glutathione hydrolase proenzyme n=1 Tax=Sphingomonas lenta TaxID=1141887 RepID=A0A2A2SF13_9SPHN|nr:gamma-glutamyltransferase [Sphingomonas lenta]PAX07795.1 gamma-glutamyltransferase [Sphingomonas lenta]